MKRFLFLLLFFFQAHFLLAQQNYFVYIQTDNKQPFYVRVQEKLYSSSSSGYLIIPRLQEGSYEFKIGFPKSEWPEQNLAVTITNTDLGFSLKNFGDNGWGLLNLQSLQLEMASNASKPAGNETAANSQDVFANTLADIVNTPSIKEKKKEMSNEPVKDNRAGSGVEEPVKKPLPVKEETITIKEPKQHSDTPVTQNKEELVAPKENELGEAAGTFIQKIFSATDTSGTSIIYTVINNSQKDTVRLLIPYKRSLGENPGIQAGNSTPVIAGIEKNKPASPGKEKEADARFLDIELENPNVKKADTPQLPKPGNTVNAIPASGLTYNSDCKSEATQADFLKARKNMAAEETDEDMITQAKKMFKQKCYSTEQVKNLGLLFLTDEGRFKLFQAAYPFVHDTQNFGTLINQLTDENYISLFKKLQNKK